MIEGVVVFAELLDFGFLQGELCVKEFGGLFRICRGEIDIEGRDGAIFCFVQTEGANAG